MYINILNNNLSLILFLLFINWNIIISPKGETFAKDFNAKKKLATLHSFGLQMPEHKFTVASVFFFLVFLAVCLCICRISHPHHNGLTTIRLMILCVEGHIKLMAKCRYIFYFKYITLPHQFGINKKTKTKKKKRKKKRKSLQEKYGLRTAFYTFW